MERQHPIKTYVGTTPDGVDYWVYWREHATLREYLEELRDVAGAMLAKLDRMEGREWSSTS